MIKKAYAIQMSYDVSSKEKLLAEKALLFFDHLLITLKSSKEQLNIIYEPFKDTMNLPPEKVFENRADLRKYRDDIIEFFNNFKTQAFKCFSMLQPFLADTQTAKLNKAFVLSVEDVEKQVNRFAELFNDLKSADFSKNVVKAIELIKKEVAQLEQIIDDRIKSHIQTNILSRSWIDNISNKLQEKVEKKIPLSIELAKEREEKNKNYV